MSIIFEPKRIGQLEVKNRLMRSATAERLVDKNGAVTDDLVSYYKVLAAGDVGTIVTGYTAVDPRGRSGWQMMAIDNNNLIKGLQQLTKTVHKYDTRILVQLNHCGRYSAGALIGTNPLAVSVEPVPNEATQEKLLRDPDAKPKGATSFGKDNKGEYPPKEATDKEIKEVIKSFVDAAYRARESGFDGVQIHSAHGYLVSQFLSPRTNKRTDDWGGSIGNRSRFLMEIIRQIRQRLGNDFPVWLKINCEDFLEPVRAERVTTNGSPAGTGSYPDYSSGMEEGLTLDDSIQVIKYLISNSAKPDALEISGGVGFDRVIRKNILSPKEEAYFLPQAEVFRKTYADLPLILVGGIRSREIIEKVLGEKKIDLVAMSRPFIRDPNFPSHLKKGEKKSTCISCNLCLGMKREPIKCRAPARLARSGGDDKLILNRNLSNQI
ncbi:MAG: NADH:flavin oxidoreductase [Planctomycetota bacterium]